MAEGEINTTEVGNNEVIIYDKKYDEIIDEAMDEFDAVGGSMSGYVMALLAFKEEIELKIKAAEQFRRDEFRKNDKGW